MKNGSKKSLRLRIFVLLTVLVSILAVCGLTTAFADEGHDPLFTPLRYLLVNPFKTADVAYYENIEESPLLSKPISVKFSVKPVAMPIHFGQKLLDSFLLGGEAVDPGDDLVPGKFVWHEPDMIPPVGNNSYRVEFIPIPDSKWSGSTAMGMVPLEVLP